LESLLERVLEARGGSVLEVLAGAGEALLEDLLEASVLGPVVVVKASVMLGLAFVEELSLGNCSGRFGELTPLSCGRSFFGVGKEVVLTGNEVTSC
jgi:hypothetical protein